MSVDWDRIEQIRAEHVSRLLAVGMAAPDAQCLYAASKRLAGRDHAYIVAVHLRTAQLLDEQRPITPSEATAALRHQLSQFVGMHGDVLDDDPDDLDDVNDIDHPHYLDSGPDDEELHDLLDGGSDE